MDSCCRVCSRSDEFRRFPVFAMADLSQEVIATMITSCSDTQVSSEDGLPQHICPDCLITLSLAYSFRKLVRRTDAKFRDSYESRRPSLSVDQQPRRSQSQAHDSTYETIPVIKEEVEFFDYECDVPPTEDQWVIQNPRTIREGAMAVVHSAQYYDEADDNAERAASALLPAGSLDDSHDPSEMGEGSGSARKYKKKAPIPEPERFSKRIRRQEVPSLNGPKFTNTLLQAPEPSWFSEVPVAEGMVGPGGRQLVINPAQQRCEYCKKKMKKSYKHRNGKCIAPKGRNQSRPRCVYCHMTFGRSTSIPGHLRNSCRAYREVCEMRGVEVPPPIDRALPSILPSSDTIMEPIASPVQEQIQSKEIDRKPVLRRTTKLSTKCQNCGQTFANRGNLIRHQRQICKFVPESDRQTRPPTEQVQRNFVEVPVPLLLDDKSAIEKIHLDVVLSNCVYCQQQVSKKTRFLHHNGRCVVGRVNAEHPCPYCPMAFSSRSNLLRHQRERCEPYREEQEPSDAIPNDVPGEPAAPTSCSPKPAEACPPKAPTLITSPVEKPDKEPFIKPIIEPVEDAVEEPVEESVEEPVEESVEEPVEEPVKQRVVAKRKAAKEATVALKSDTKKLFFKQSRQRIREPDRPKHHERRSVVMKSLTSQQSDYSCGYCRKAFSSRDSLLEHHHMCTVRKLHKQVKCQYCGVHISNRGNLRKHQKVYCKHAPGKAEVKSEAKEDKETPKKQQTIKPINKIKQEKVKEVNKAPSDLTRKKTGKAHSSEQKEKKPRSSSEPKDKKLKSSSEKKDKKLKPSPEQKEKKPSPSSTPKERKLGLSPGQKERKPKLKPRHPCEYCKRLFKTRGKVRTHYRKCNVKRSMGKFSCEYCSQGFANKGNMIRHQRSKCKGTKRDENILNDSIENCLQPEHSKSVSANQVRTDEDTDEEDTVKTSNRFNALLEPDLQTIVEQNQPQQEQDEPQMSDGDEYIEPHTEPEPEPELEPEQEPEPAQQSKPEQAPEPELERQESRLLDNNNAECEKEPEIDEMVEQEATSPIEMEEEFQPEQQPSSEEILPDSEHDRQPVLYQSVTEADHTN